MALHRSAHVSTSLDAVKSFLEPAINAEQAHSQDTPVETLSKLLVASEGIDSLQASRQVLLKACSSLSALNQAAEDQENANHDRVPMIDTDIVTTVQRLLDLVVIEGLYPSLSPNVGLQSERKRSSILYKRVSNSLPDLKLLDEIVFQTLLPLVTAPSSAIARLVRDRHLIDMIAALIDAAFSPDKDEGCKTACVEKLNQVLNRTPVQTLYTLLTSLLRPSAPSWFKTVISENLAILPLRPGGVKWAMEFVALSHIRNDANAKSTITYQTLQQITNVLCSIPSSMSQAAHLTRISQQLLDLLDDPTNVELSQVAAFVITNGILSKKATGSPGSVGWELYVMPIHTLFGSNRWAPVPGSLNHSEKTVITQKELQVQLRRLSALVLSSPSPAITGRLIRPILLPLWALYVFEGSRVSSADWNNMAKSLLQTFLKRCGTKEHLILISANLVFEGSNQWIFAPGSDGGVEIRSRLKSKDDPDAYQLISKINYRVSAFLDLLSDDTIESNIIGELFINLMTKSDLSVPETSLKSQKTLKDPDPDPVQELVRLQLLQRIIQLSSDKLKLSTDQMLQFINKIIEDDLESRDKSQSWNPSASQITMAELTSITRQNEQKVGQASETDDHLATAIGLLNVLLSSHEGNFTQNALSQSVLRNLEALNSRYARHVSPSTLSSINSAITMLHDVMQQQEHEAGPPRETPQQLDRNMLNRITEDLASDQAPVRTATIKALQRFIHLKIMTMDIPTVFLILINQIRTDNEEFVFLAAITALSSLAAVRDPIYVTRATAEAFQDTREATGIDGRLRVGEALVTLVHDTATMDQAPTMIDIKFNIMLREVAQILINVASRRGNRKRESKERDKAERVARIQKRRAEMEWGGEVPDFSSIGIEDEDDFISAQEQAWLEKEAALSQDVLSTWQNTGLEEDIRIRTSALSILGSLLETVPSIFNNELLRSSVMIAQSILQFELGTGKAILRRAAVLIFMAHLRTVAGSHGTATDAQLNGMQWLEIETLLKNVIQTEEDDLTNEHAKAVIEGLEAWRLQKVREVADGLGQNESIDELRGLSINPTLPKMTMSKIQELD